MFCRGPNSSQGKCHSLSDAIPTVPLEIRREERADFKVQRVNAYNAEEWEARFGRRISYDEIEPPSVSRATSNSSEGTSESSNSAGCIGRSSCVGAHPLTSV